jgi:CDP-diacylglycerol--glycerol-3-phosphate 3-phosphatidyltransferase
MVAVIALRELIVQALRSSIEGQGIAFGARWAGKLKTVFQFLSLGAVLVVLGELAPGVVTPRLRDLMTGVAVGLTIYSGLSYLWIARGQFRDDLF